MANKPLVNTISDNYKILKVLGQGCYGQVVHCLKQDTKENVAVKVLKERHQQYTHQRELNMLDKLRCLDPEKNSIVRCHEWFCKIDRTFMVFEMLDMSVLDYLCRTRPAPLPLQGIRTIIKDVATALNALKGFGLIHTDLKMDNIMLVNHQKQPFRTKLIDFGLTVEKSEVWPGLKVQPLWNRAPEVIVGFPFTEAIDIWSLGAVMAELLIGFPLFPGKHEYDVLRFIVELLGELPKRLLDRGKNTSTYFYSSLKYRLFINWKLKTPFEYYAATGIKPEERRTYKPFSLDDLKTSSQHKKNSAEAAERSACVELLKEMFQMDPKNRITPSQILEDPFILWSYLSLSNQCATELPPGVVMVKPAKNTVQREEATIQRSCITPQAVEDKKIDSPEDEYDSDCILQSISDISSVSSLTVDSGNKSVTTNLSMDNDIEIISLDSTNSHTEAPDTVSTQASESTNSPVTLEVSEPKKKEKKGIRRFFSYLKKTLFSCCCVSKVNE